MNSLPRSAIATPKNGAALNRLLQRTRPASPAFFSSTQQKHSDKATSVKATTQTPVQNTSMPPSDVADKDSQQPRKKTMAELDEELRLKMEGMAGDGGASGVEYENGKAEGLKRGVKDNMFRVI